MPVLGHASTHKIGASDIVASTVNFQRTKLTSGDHGRVSSSEQKIITEAVVKGEIKLIT